MPNYVDCRLIIRCFDSSDDQKVHALMGDSFECDAIIPYPKHFRDLDEAARAWDKDNDPRKPGAGPRPRDGFNSGGYEWKVENWGTKWGACDATFAKNEWRFQTAWKPPLPVIRALSAKFPSVRFELHYFEQGMEVGGIFTISGDDEENHHTFRYKGWLGG